MSLAEIATLIVTLSLKDEISKGVDTVKTNLGGLAKQTDTTRGGLEKIGRGLKEGFTTSAKIAAGGIGILAYNVAQGFDSLAELQDVTAQTEAVIASTGGAAGITAEEVRKLAEQYENLTGVDDKVIQDAENVLLTFTKIGKDAFPGAMEAALDMSAALDQDLQSSIVQVGKALNDPKQGLSALSRVGVTFDEETKKIIQNMVDMGDTAGAQQLIIQELNREFGGAAQSKMSGYRGTMTRLKDTVDSLQMALAEALAPAIDKVAKAVDEKLNDPRVIDGLRSIGQEIAKLFSDENIDKAGQAFEDAFTFLAELPWDSIKEGLRFTAEQAKKVVDVFKSLPPGVQAGLLTFLAANKLTGGLVTSGLGELAKVALRSLTTIQAANVTVVGGSVNGGVPGVPTTTPGTGRVGQAIQVVGAVTIAGAAAMFIDSLGQEQAEALRSVQFDSEMAHALESTGTASSVRTLAAVPFAGVIQNALGPGFANAWGQIVGFTQQSAGYDQKIAASSEVTSTIIGQVKLGIDLAKQAQQTGNTEAQRANLIAAEVRDRLGASGPIASSIGQVRGVVVGTGTRTADGIGQVRGVVATVARQTGTISEDTKQVKRNTDKIARKDLKVDVKLTTNFRVSAREVATAINHYRSVSDVGGVDVS